MNLVTLDFETYYSRDYSLSKMTTEEYVRHPEFEVIGMAIKQGDLPTLWIDQPDVKNALAAVDWGNSMVLAQNTMFDGAIMSWHYGINPKAWADTLGMSRALYPHEKGHSLAAQADRMGIGAKGDEVLRAMGKRRKDFTPMEIAAYADYCVNDVDLTYKLFNMYMAQGFPTKELRLIDLTLRMFIEPVLELDHEVLIKHLQEVKDHKANLLEKLKGLMIEQGNEDFVHTIFTEGTDGLKKLLMSNDKFAKALDILGVMPPLKQSPTTGRTTYAFAKTDPGMIALQEHGDPQVQALVAARLGNKTTLEETRTERFIDMSFRGKFPVPLRYYGAHSGRWSGCLVADTEVTVYDPIHGVTTKKIVDVLLDDLVWDGEEFVAHEGVKFSGYQEVIEWDGVRGTPDHVVFTDAGEISLRDAMQGAHRITVARSPDADAVDAARRLAHDD